MNFKRSFIGVFASAGLLTIANAAGAASAGGASISITDGKLESKYWYYGATGAEGETPGSGGLSGYDFDISGNFLAKSLISDFDAIRSYRASASLTYEGSSLFSGSVMLPPASINDFLGVLDDTGLFSFFAPVLTNATGGLNILGLPVTYSYSDIVTGPNSISGIFALHLTLTSDQLANLTYLFCACDGDTPLASASFSMELDISAVPIPAALPLALSGFALLGGFGFRRRRSMARS